IDFTAIKASILQDVFKQTDSIANGHQDNNDVLVRNEIHALYPQVRYYSLSSTVFHHTDTTLTDTVIIGIFNVENKLSEEETEKLHNWLKAKLQADSVRIIIE